jgi:hypothetical protein
MAARWIETRDVPIAWLARFPGNPRRGSVEEIRRSVRRHGQYRAIVVRLQGGRHTILAGNHTADALQAEGHVTARCELIECDDDEARRIVAADNRLPELGTYDDGDLALLLATLDGDFAGTGWDVDDVGGLADALGGAGPGGDVVGPAGDGGDAPVDDLPEAWGVIVECGSEAEQAALLGELDGRGHRVRALMA